MSQPAILIAVLNYRTTSMTLKAAEIALRETAGLNVEMIIVDNDSRDGSFNAIARAAQLRGWTKNHKVRVLGSGRNGGFGAGNNLAIQQNMSDGTPPDYVYLLNSDAFVDPGAVQTLLSFMEENPQVGFAGSQLRGEANDPHTTHFRFPTLAGEFEQSIKLGVVSRMLKDAQVPMAPTDVPVQADWVAGASLMIRRAMLAKIGQFDETFFLYFEETDLCRRARLDGWETWFVPQSTVMHIGSVSTGMKTWRRTPTYWFDSRRHYYLKNHGRAYLAGANAARILGGGLWRLRCLLTARPIGEPSWFLADLIQHTLRMAMPRLRISRGPNLTTHHLAKDSK